jgi:hypothetical protein
MAKIIMDRIQVAHCGKHHGKTLRDKVVRESTLALDRVTYARACIQNDPVK